MAVHVHALCFPRSLPRSRRGQRSPKHRPCSSPSFSMRTAPGRLLAMLLLLLAQNKAVLAQVHP